MKTPVFFRKDFACGKEISISAEEKEHLNSLRLFARDKEIEIRNGKGKSCFYNVPASAKKGELVNITEAAVAEQTVQIATAIPKGNRMDLILQKGTELGVTEFIFVNFRRSERREINRDRCDKIIAEAASQSRRYYLPEVTHYDSLEELYKNHPDLVILLPDAEVTASQKLVSDYIPVIGPEGGFDDAEKDFIRQNQLLTARLGGNILRIETAAVLMAGLKSWFHFSM